jgi:hypothetical protein
VEGHAIDSIDLLLAHDIALDHIFEFDKTHGENTSVYSFVPFIISYFLDSDYKTFINNKKAPHGVLFYVELRWLPAAC